MAWHVPILHLGIESFVEAEVVVPLDRATILVKVSAIVIVSRVFASQVRGPVFASSVLRLLVFNNCGIGELAAVGVLVLSTWMGVIHLASPVSLTLCRLTELTIVVLLAVALVLLLPRISSLSLLLPIVFLLLRRLVQASHGA